MPPDLKIGCTAVRGEKKDLLKIRKWGFETLSNYKYDAGAVVILKTIGYFFKHLK